MRLAVSVLLFVGCVVSIQAQVSVRARLDSAAMLLGDPNRLVVTVEGSSEDALVDWSPLDTVSNFTPTDQPTQQRQGNEQRFALPFSVYDSVGLLLPMLPVYVGGETLMTNDLALLVDFPPSDTTLNPYRPLDEEPLALRDFLPWIVAGVVMLALLIGALYFFYFAREEKAPPPAAPPIPAHEQALVALQVLRKRTELDDKTYYSELDHILRQYLEGRYTIPALERTSREVIDMLSEHRLPDQLALGDLLTQVDLVKFAKAELPAEQRLQALTRVEQFVLATVPPPPPVTPETPDA